MNIFRKYKQQTAMMVVVFVLLVSPFAVLAQPSFTGDIVPDCGTTGGVTNVCGYCDLMLLAETIVDFLVFLAVLIAVLMIVYAGWLYLTAGSNAGQVSKAHSTFRVAIFGLVLTLAAWLLIDLLVTMLGVKARIGDPWVLPGC